MDERLRRQWAATEALTFGWGGISLVSAATGLARNTVAAGVRELSHRAQHPNDAVASRLRAPGGGRKRAIDVDPDLMRALELLVEPATRGDPESPLRWTCKSTRIDASESSCHGPHGRRTPQASGLQLASQSQDAGGDEPS